MLPFFDDSDFDYSNVVPKKDSSKMRFSKSGIPIFKVSDKVEALNECLNKQYYEDVAGHLCDLLAYVANKRNMSVTQLLEYYGKNITPISD